MRQLLLLRHAKSSWDERDQPDHARPLNPRGQQAAAAMRTAMTGLGLVPDLILVSTARRTQQTRLALEPWPETPLLDELDTLYLASAETMLAIMRETRETVRSLLLIGHNPGLHELAIVLAGPASLTQADPDARRLAEGFPSGALTEFTIPGPWQTLAPGAGRLVRFIAPRDLPGG